jgi:hypothetical protein
VPGIKRNLKTLFLRRDYAKTIDRIKNDLTLQLYNNRKLPIKMRREMDMQECIEEVQKLISSYKANKAYHFLPNS